MQRPKGSGCDAVAVAIESLGSGHYEVMAQAAPVNLFGETPSATVSLTLGYSSSSIRTSF